MNFEKPSVVLCEDDKSALDLYNILISIYPQDNISYFPAHDSLPFSNEKSSKEIPVSYTHLTLPTILLV